MESSENTYCRFCAELKSSDKLLYLYADEKRYNDIMMKLDFLNAIYVEVSNRDSLPKTVCFVCYDSLNKAYEFLDKVKKSQEILVTVFSCPVPDTTRYDLSDDNRAALDDFLTADTVEDDIPDVKPEIQSPNKQKLTPLIEVKVEPKEETDASNILNEIQESTYEQTLNVNDIIDAALCSGPFDSNITIYAKELTDLSKKDVVSWKNYPWVCGFCDIEFLDIDMLRSHAKIVHDKCAAFSCIDCKGWKKEKNFNSFIKHVRKHRKNLRNHCHFCDDRIDPVTLLSTHLKMHFVKTNVVCPTCGVIFENQATLTQHIQDYLTVKPKRKPRRKAGTPITIEELTCHICKKIYKNPNSLRDHIKRHTSDRKRNYTCDRCGKTFYNKGTLTSHIMAHDQIKPHVCRICNKSFLFPNMLRRHVEMHSGVKPYSCEQCGRCFRLQYQMNAHKIVHTDSMPYICQYCNKAFRFKQILKNHENQHTGAKPYSCHFCGMEFSNWSNYNKHMKRRHNTDTSKKKITPEGVFPINPQTGQIVQCDQAIAEWKSKIMLPVKRGKKKVIKQEGS